MNSIGHIQNGNVLRVKSTFRSVNEKNKTENIFKIDIFCESASRCANRCHYLER